MKNLLVIATLLISWPLGAAYAQSQLRQPTATSPTTETLTNSQIIALTTAGLSAEVIKAKIETTASIFDLSTNGLMALKQAKVADSVIQAMLTKSFGKSDNTGTTMVNKALSPAPKIAIANHPYLRNSTTGLWMPLEKETAMARMKIVGMGYGGAKMVYQIPNEKSPSRLATTDSVMFLINPAGTTLPDFVLYKATPKRDAREATSMKATAFKGATVGQDILTFTISPAGNGLFRLVPSTKLAPGEYFFAGKATDVTPAVDAYAFGID